MTSLEKSDQVSAFWSNLTEYRSIHFWQESPGNWLTPAITIGQTTPISVRQPTSRQPSSSDWMPSALTDLSVEAADFGAEIVYPENEAAHPDYSKTLIQSVEDYRKIAPIDPRQGRRMSEHIKLCRKLVEAKGKDTPIIAFTFGPLGILSMLRGQEKMFMDLVLEPDSVKYAVSAITETLMDYYDALIDTGVHAIMIDTLFASQSIMSKSMWKEFEGQYVRNLADKVHQRGCMMMIHNCGHGIYFDVQIETMQPEAISFLHLPDDVSTPEELKEKYGRQTTLIGHISPTWIITASEDEVRKACKEQIDWYKDGGGYVLATGCEYPANADLRNAEVMVGSGGNIRPLPVSEGH